MKLQELKEGLDPVQKQVEAALKAATEMLEKHFAAQHKDMTLDASPAEYQKKIHAKNSYLFIRLKNPPPDVIVASPDDKTMSALAKELDDVLSDKFSKANMKIKAQNAGSGQIRLHVRAIED